MRGEIMSSKWVNRLLFVSTSTSFALGALGLAASGAALVGCAETQHPPRIEDDARKNTPIPACIMRLPPRIGAQKGFVRNLREDQFWELVFPAFDAKKKELPKDSLTCTGKAVYTDPLFNGGESAKGWPRLIEDGDILYGSGGDRIKILWMRTHRWSDDTEAGPLALVRTQEDYAELYAVGAYRGQTRKPYFQMERMGSEAIVTAEDDGCVGADVTAPCENTLTVFLPRAGQLVALTTITLEQRAYALGGEPGIFGRTEYKGTTSPKFVDGAIKLLEQVLVTDDTGRPVRKAERHRTLALQDTQLVQDQPALFPQIYPRQSAR